MITLQKHQKVMECEERKVQSWDDPLKSIMIILKKTSKTIYNPKKKSLCR